VSSASYQAAGFFYLSFFRPAGGKTMNIFFLKAVCPRGQTAFKSFLAIGRPGPEYYYLFTFCTIFVRFQNKKF